MALDNRIKHRLVGALVLISLAVIFVPMVLDGQGQIPAFVSDEIPANPNRNMDAWEFAVTPVPTNLSTRDADEPGSLLRNILSKLGFGAGEVDRATPNDSSEIVTWMVQVGTFGEEKNAVNLRDRMRKEGISTHVDKTEVDGKTMWRLRAGPEVSRDKAVSLQSQIAKSFAISGLVVQHP